MSPRRAVGSVILLAIGVAVVLAALFATGFIPRASATEELNADADGCLERTGSGERGASGARSGDIEISVPGTLRPWQEVSIFARTTGYLKKWYVDISDQVKAGPVAGRD